MNKFLFEQSSGKPCLYLGEPAKLFYTGDQFFLTMDDSSAGKVFTQKIFDEAFENGYLVFTDGNRDAFVQPSVSESIMIQADYWGNYISELEMEEKRGSISTRRRVIDKVSAKIRDLNPPSPSTLYVRYKRYKESSIGILGAITPKNRKSLLRASAPVETLFYEIMDDFYLKPKGALTLNACYGEMLKRYKKCQLDPDDPLSSVKCVSKAQFYTWANTMLLTPDQLAKKMSQSERNRVRRKAIKNFKFDHILERTEVDAAQFNIGLLDNDGNYLGAPIVYAAIDCYSRAILGFYVQVGKGENASGVLKLLQQFLAPNNLDGMSCLNTMPMYGLPSMLVSDAGPAFNAHQVKAFMKHLKVAHIVTEVRQPWKKPFIERFFGTCRTQFLFSLLGYVGKRTDQKEQDLTMQQSAVMTLEEFTTLLTQYIVDDYHQRPHSGLNKPGSKASRTPYSAWLEGAKMAPPVVPAIADQFRLIRGEVTTRKLQREGVRINNIWYQSNELDKLVLDSGLGYPQEVLVQRDTEDLGSITVVLPKLGARLNVPAKSDYDELNGVSLGEYRAREVAQWVDQDNQSFGTHRFIQDSEVYTASQGRKRKRKPSGNNTKLNLDSIDSQAAHIQAFVDAVEHTPASLTPDVSDGLDFDDDLIDGFGHV
ncbi:hypothetical protein A8C75_11610 [Marinobacterium aestuarii]|uniref:Integrase catalytic domain-containing protein n=1 Tax=Marinobacterium aestuarii TaxID=1821621 RepID=A0A1A9EYT5_9GAMM|nr:Mu transposase C-terminal domain-containing protein [Marinobacterium aestuarii]ANG63055.1 hypothetical protein A8C75_11610 [Marinobacterium aestuarii]